MTQTMERPTDIEPTRQSRFAVTSGGTVSEFQPATQEATPQAALPAEAEVGNPIFDQLSAEHGEQRTAEAQEAAAREAEEDDFGNKYWRDRYELVKRGPPPGMSEQEWNPLRDDKLAMKEAWDNYFEGEVQRAYNEAGIGAPQPQEVEPAEPTEPEVVENASPSAEEDAAEESADSDAPEPTPDTKSDPEPDAGDNSADVTPEAEPAAPEPPVETPEPAADDLDIDPAEPEPISIDGDAEPDDPSGLAGSNAPTQPLPVVPAAEPAPVAPPAPAPRTTPFLGGLSWDAVAGVDYQVDPADPGRIDIDPARTEAASRRPRRAARFLTPEWRRQRRLNNVQNVLAGIAAPEQVRAAATSRWQRIGDMRRNAANRIGDFISRREGLQNFGDAMENLFNGLGDIAQRGGTTLAERLSERLRITAENWTNQTAARRALGASATFGVLSAEAQARAAAAAAQNNPTN